ncbi:MAG TPA: gluconate 2-dehydrogenase subunit 3 family protein [Candidatus Sulfotelmatobacter sp.]|nr:gluconate 2-dehydrogenase subunit 3 family protein [Candidatus Sulfotelmatobacter sp.]
MKNPQEDRRNFLLQVGGVAGAAWMNVQWPAIVAAADHAHQAANAKTPGKFEVFTQEQARQVEAVAAQIIPTDDSPGAREAGVVYFIDRALKTFASAAVPVYEKGIAHLNQLTAENYAEVKSFADASAEQQGVVLQKLVEEESGNGGYEWPGTGSSRDFFETIRLHTIWGFLADPSAGGNRDYVGWKAVGRDPEFMFSAPFGYYDKNYPGWQAAKAEAEKK